MSDKRSRKDDVSILVGSLTQLHEKMDHLHTCLHKTKDELKDMIHEVDKKVDIQATEMAYVKVLDEQQNRILDEHHRRSDELKKDNELREAALRRDMEGVVKRVQSLEAPKKWAGMTKKMILNLGKLAGALTALGGLGYGIAKLLEKL